MDLFCALDGLDSISLSGTNADGWYIDEAKKALEDGSISFAGKYSAPDYELILSKNCDLAIESTMIYHKPEVKEKLEQFGIPVLVEHSSYESHPLGRTEWLKLYGVLLGKEELADKLFQEQVDKLKAIEDSESTGKTVAFFYINSVGAANVRKSGDYVSKMIELAGGKYIFSDLGAEDDNSLSTMNMQMEEFYAGAKDADYIIYNSTIDGELTDISQMLEKSSLLADFKAVKDGNVWCTNQNLFQETMELGTMIEDIHTMLTSDDPNLDTLTYMAGGRRANFDKVSSDTLGFVKKLEVRPLKQRFHYVMFKKDDKKTQRKMNLFILGVSVIWFVASYYFILQPDYSIPQADVQEDNTPFIAMKILIWKNKKMEVTFSIMESIRKNFLKKM